MWGACGERDTYEPLEIAIAHLKLKPSVYAKSLVFGGLAEVPVHA